MNGKSKLRLEKARLIVLPSLLAAIFGFLLSSSEVHQTVHAFSSGPPPGYTGAPGEESEACAECHVPADAGTGQISITAPQTYIPGQTYQVTVTHANADPTRLRWGFQLTVLDSADAKAGNLQSTGPLTQVLDNAGPGAARQYIEHSSAGTFIGQQNGASWTFDWTAPPTDVGPLLFFAAGNQANNDGNTSGDYVYKTFVASAPASSIPDFAITLTPGSRLVTPGASAQYSVTITPLAGFLGIVNLSAIGLPSGASASFSPAVINILDPSSQTSTLTINTTAGTPLGNYTIDISGLLGLTSHNAQVTLKVISTSSVDLSLSKSASPNPAQVGNNISYRVTVTNNGPAAATNVNVTDSLPSGIVFVSASTTQGSCSGTGPVNCNIGSLAVGANAVVTITVTPTAAGQITNIATTTASEVDPETTNNSASVVTLVESPPPNPILLDASLSLKTVVTGLNQPTTMAFISSNEFFVLEKATGRVQRVFNGQLQTVALDLAVNNASERGLLGIALHPSFPATPWVYLYWTESSTGADTGNTDQVPILGNRVDRYIWNGFTLAHDRNIIRLRALQADAGQPARGNHNGGVIRFGPDGKLYIVYGDNGRRGLLQNITSGGPVPDDQFGGPEPDDAHMTGVILRLNDDGSSPADNPFFNASTPLSGEAAANIKKIFAYGVRNSFGMAFDPVAGNLWTQENGDDAFDEINRVAPGFNGGWIQIMGPLSRVAEFKSIEVGRAGGLQQDRWPPTLLADTPQQALARLYMLPGATYADPQFSWKYAVAPSAIGFVRGNSLGSQFNGDLLVGASRTTLHGGYLFRLKLASNRLTIAPTDQRLQDRVADNLDKFDITESESLLFGKNFGVATDIQTGPDGNVYVVSLLNGAVYQISAANALQLSSSTFTVGENVGSAAIVVNRTGNTAGTVSVNYTTSDNAGLNPCSLVNAIASSRCDYATTVGTLRFGPGEVLKTIYVPIVADGISDGSETFTVSLSSPEGATLGAINSAAITITNDGSITGNPLDQTAFFVRQHYIDFLGREPEPQGLQDWQNILNNCGTTVPPPCDRIEVSSAFFRSAEFQSRGYFVYRFYSTLSRIPLYPEFMPDFAKVSGFLSDQELEANRAAFTTEFMARQEFRNRYDPLATPTAYVDGLLQAVGLPNHPGRAAWIAGLANGSFTRAQVLRALVESNEVYLKYFNEAFVIMQYFGYLRRTADISYLDWINTMNSTGGDYRIMINGFLNSVEYRQRFGP